VKVNGVEDSPSTSSYKWDLVLCVSLTYKREKVFTIAIANQILLILPSQMNSTIG